MSIEQVAGLVAIGIMLFLVGYSAGYFVCLWRYVRPVVEAKVNLILDLGEWWDGWKSASNVSKD